MPTAYEVLGVAEDAPAEEVDRAYREAVRRSHPDRGGDVRGYDLAVRAGKILRDPQSRVAYDDRLRRARGDTPRRASPRRIAAKDILAALRFVRDVAEEIRKIRGVQRGGRGI